MILKNSISLEEILMANIDEQYENAYAMIKQDREKSIELYQKLLKKDPSHQNGNHDLTMLYIYNGEYKKAIKQAKIFYQKYPEDYRVYNCLGYIFYKKGQFKKAIEYFKEVLKRNPDFWGAYLNIGLSYLNLLDYHKAEEYFRKALEIEPSYQAFFGMGICFSSQHNYDNAEKYLKQLRGNNPVVKEAKLMLKWIKELKKDPDSSEIKKHFSNYLKNVIRKL